MAGSVNKVILIGNVGKDPEIRNTQDGGKIVNLTMATSETWNDKASGERKEKTEWHRVVCFNDRTSDVIEKFVRKGSKIYVEGALQTRKWTDKDGADRYSTEIVIGRFNGQLTMLDSKGADDSAPRAQPASKPKVAGGGGNDLDDEIPFAACWQ